MATAAVIIIGNEILTGKFPDENGPYFIRRLRDLGVDLQRITVVPDEIDVIADEVRRASQAHDHVFTTGGVGPTHDDVTLEAVASAFGVPMERKEQLVELIERFDLPMDEANLRMATVPAGTEILTHQAMAFPTLRCRNVVILPGVPRLLQAKFEVLAPSLAAPTIATARVYLTEREGEVAQRLGQLATRHPRVDIGSYPRFGEADYRLILTLESRDRDALEAAHADVRAHFRVVEIEQEAG